MAQMESKMARNGIEISFTRSAFRPATVLAGGNARGPYSSGHRIHVFDSMFSDFLSNRGAAMSASPIRASAMLFTLAATFLLPAARAADAIAPKDVSYPSGGETV